MSELVLLSYYERETLVLFLGIVGPHLYKLIIITMYFKYCTLTAETWSGGTLLQQS